MSQISVNGLSFTYDGSFEPVFEHVSFSIDTDWRLGFIGRNGRGKTTFLRLLTGELQYSGSITASTEFDYFPFPVADGSLLCRQIAGDISPGVPEWRLLREMALLELGDDVLDRPFSTLSGGESAKLLLAALFLRENSFLLIDEPTNHLDARGRKIMETYLAGKRGFILVSHDRAFLDGCIDHVLSINRANIEVQQGNFSSWAENKRRRDAFELSENDRLKKDIKRLRESARKAENWADKAESTKIGVKRPEKQELASRGYIGEKSRRMQQRRKNLERRQDAAIEEKSGLLKNVERADALKLTSLPCRGRLLEARDLSINYGGRAVFEHVSFTLEAGERLALCGPNGCGKTSVLKLIMGEEIRHDGGFTRKNGLVVSYVPQDTGFLQGGLSDFSEGAGIDLSRFLTILRKLDFSRAQLERPMQEMSGGQKKKVLIAKSLCESAHLYVWDEPLNFIDIESRMQIEDLLLEYAPTMVFVEHDRVFSGRVATGILEF